MRWKPWVVIIIFFLLTLIIVPAIAFAARFDWVLGLPMVTDDDNNTVDGARYDWSLGIPDVAWTRPTVEKIEVKSQTIKIKAGTVKVK